jgi:electron transfer flavoprotein alpha subunit
MSILVIAEGRDGNLKKATFEAVTYAQNVARELNTNVVVFAAGNFSAEELKKTALYGADKILRPDTDLPALFDNNYYIELVYNVAQKTDAQIIIFSSGFVGKSVASGVAARLNAGIASSVNSLPNSYNPFIISHQAFSGKVVSKTSIDSSQKVLVLAGNSVQPTENPKNTIPESFVLPASLPQPGIELILEKKSGGTILLSEAERVVSGGRGMKGPEMWGPIEELAAELGAATACSRPVSDEGWRSHHEHVGQTGKVIAPSLYIACGISGAIQHVAGISSSKVIVAINKDPEAPVFSVANYGIVGDVHKVLPQLIASVKELKAQG